MSRSRCRRIVWPSVAARILKPAGEIASGRMSSGNSAGGLNHPANGVRLVGGNSSLNRGEPLAHATPSTVHRVLHDDLHVVAGTTANDHKSGVLAALHLDVEVVVSEGGLAAGVDDVDFHFWAFLVRGRAARWPSCRRAWWSVSCHCATSLLSDPPML